MAKYRRLLKEELVIFEKEFVDFLVVNGIVAEDWEKLKVNEPEKAEKMVDLFSDVILESVMRKAQFLEIHTANYVQGVQCLADKMIMIAVNCKDQKQDMRLFMKESPKELWKDEYEILQGEKKYAESREMDIFNMTKQGFSITDGELFKELMIATVK